MVLTVYTNKWIGDYSDHSTYYTCDINNIEFVDENACILHISPNDGNRARIFTIAAALEERGFYIKSMILGELTCKLYVRIPYMGQLKVCTVRR